MYNYDYYYTPRFYVHFAVLVAMYLDVFRPGIRSVSAPAASAVCFLVAITARRHGWLAESGMLVVDVFDGARAVGESRQRGRSREGERAVRVFYALLLSSSNYVNICIRAPTMTSYVALDLFAIYDLLHGKLLRHRAVT